MEKFTFKKNLPSLILSSKNVASAAGDDPIFFPSMKKDAAAARADIQSFGFVVGFCFK